MPKSLQIVLLFTRLSIAAFLAPWVHLRLTNIGAGKHLFSKYYKVSDMPDIAAYGIAIFWLILLVAFVTGFKKRLSYGLVLLFHTAGTVFTLPYLVPGSENFQILFFAALPTVAAMLLLYILRREDTLLSFKGKWS